MTVDLAQALQARGIYLRNHKHGEHRARCPQCGRSKRDDTLAVRIDGDGAAWFCHRAGCNWSGAVRNRHCTQRPRHRDAAFDATMERLRTAPGQPGRLRPIAGPLKLWDDAGFLAGLDKLIERRLAASASSQARNYAPKMMVQHGVCDGFSERELERAMRRLLKAEEIIADARLWQKGNRHYASGLARRS